MPPNCYTQPFGYSGDQIRYQTFQTFQTPTQYSPFGPQQFNQQYYSGRQYSSFQGYYNQPYQPYYSEYSPFESHQLNQPSYGVREYSPCQVYYSQYKQPDYNGHYRLSDAHYSQYNQPCYSGQFVSHVAELSTNPKSNENPLNSDDFATKNRHEPPSGQTSMPSTESVKPTLESTSSSIAGYSHESQSSIKQKSNKQVCKSTAQASMKYKRKRNDAPSKKTSTPLTGFKCTMPPTDSGVLHGLQSPSDALVHETAHNMLEPLNICPKYEVGCDNTDMIVKASDDTPKKLCCPFCDKMLSKLGRHIQSVHADEVDVQTVLRYPKEFANILNNMKMHPN